MNITAADIQESAKKCLIEAGTKYRDDQFQGYQQAIEKETESNAKWVLQQIYKNGQIAKEQQLPLCDDTRSPHAILQVGDECSLPAGWLKYFKAGIVDGLRKLPGRPMAVRGNDIERVEQSRGLEDDPGMMELAPIITRSVPGDKLKMTVLMLGGGPEIRARTRRIFHKRSIDKVIGEATGWLQEEIGSLGCSPSIVAMGIGRSQVEASALMLEAMAEGDLNNQSELEQRVTHQMNETNVGPLGLGGAITVLGCFLKIGPTRASGVRIVCARPCCLVEPRRGTAILG